MAIHVGPRPLQPLSGVDGACRFAPRTRLRFDFAEFLRHVLFRQNHHPALLVPADVFLGGLRVVYRYLHYRRTLKRVRIADATPTLVLGRAADAEVLLRGIESGAVKKIWPVGVLSPSTADRGQSIRGIPVLGDIDDLERIVADLEASGDRVMRLVLAPSALDLEARPEAILMRARRLGLSISQLPSLDADGPAVQLAPVAVEDLLLRPSVRLTTADLKILSAGGRLS